MFSIRFAAIWPALLANAGAAPLASEFQRDIRPVLSQYCLGCHSTAKRAGELDLERFAAFDHVLQDPKPWRKAVEQLGLGEMPPKGMPQLPPAAKARLLAWIDGAMKTAAQARAGDPGPVVLRRLNNAEYTYTIRDLTGVAALDPAREFPADGAAGEGFMNTGNALAMSPSLVSKYLDAGKSIAAHAMLLPDRIRFSPVTSRRDQTEELLAAIRAFYAAHTEQGGADTVTQQGIALDKNRGGSLPLETYLKASLERRGAAADANAVARRHGLSPKYLGMLAALLQGGRPSPLMDGLRARWRTARPSDVEAMAKEIAQWRETLWKFSSVGHIGKVGGPKAWMEPVSPIVSERPFRVKLAAPADGGDIAIYLAAHDAGDGSANDSVVWREPRLEIPGRAPVLLRDLPALVERLAAERTRVLAAAAHDLETGAAGAWRDFVGPGTAPKLDLLTKKIERSGSYDFVKGWGSAQAPMLLANASTQTVRVPGVMKPGGVAVHPSPTHATAIGWKSPVEATLRIEGEVKRVHAECGNGVTWSVELRRGGVRLRLAEGELRNAAPFAFGPFDNVRVLPGDLVSVLVGPRDGNHSCDLTDVELRLSGGGSQWPLGGDVAGDVLAANPHADSAGRAGVWHFYSEPVADDGTRGALVPAGSTLGRWMMSNSASERGELAEALQKLLTGPAPPASDTSPDAVLHRRLASLASPLLARVTAPPGAASADIAIRAPSVREVRLPASFAAGGEFVTTGGLDPVSGAEGSVQLEVLTAKPAARAGLLPAGTTVGDAKGTWSSNNQTVAYSMPVIAREGSAARRRVEAAFDEFRQMFPASLCYTKIVPVDEVVTLTLYHREDGHLSRLLLDAGTKAKLDRLWDELHYVSRDALTLVDAFEQLWQFATQDADPSKFEPLRQPINARAAAFRQQLLDSEPRHVEGVVEFAGRAYRRPLTEVDRTQLRGLYRQLRAQELAHEDAIRLMLARVLVSPAFLYKAENTRPGTQATPVDDYELASRLSYFLWSSKPDAPLMAAAASGKLRNAAGLRAEARRMLRDPRSRRLAIEFGAAWLHIHGFDSLDEKSERLFPEFRQLRGDMYEETIRFFTGLFANDGSVLSILDADHTFVNEALAKHYGIPGVSGPEWRRVDGVKRYSRGGVLGQAAVLAKHSGASRTSPILRGIWISETLLGDKLPRPPKDVPPLPAGESESLSVRELTERHTKDQRCSGCHSRIDPYGYTLERFDTVGRLREHDSGGRPIDDRSVLRDGSRIDGAEGLRAYLLAKGRPAFVRQFCKKLLGYALGREVELSDEPLLDAMQTRLAANGYHAGIAIDEIVASRQFREIRGRDHEEQRR